MGDIWNSLKELREIIRDLAAELPNARGQRLLSEFDAICAEGAARDQEREALLHEVTLVLSCTAANRVLGLILDAVVRLSGAQRGYLLLSRLDDTHEVVASRNMSGSDKDVPAEISRQVVGTVLAKGRAICLADALNTPPFSGAESVSRLKLLSVLCVPIQADERIIGAVYLENRKASGIFTAATERIVTDFAGRIGTAIRNAESQEELREARDELQAALAKEYEFEGIVGVNNEFRTALKTVGIAARSDIPVIIEGESGTGKELLARAIHLRSSRRNEEFVSVNCAALPGTLLESELFGHTRGAFTGAVRDRRGLFASAHRGTLFLDELGEMPLDLQAKLLRVLQSGEYRPVGSDATRTADVRIVAATQRDLRSEVAERRFREDLFFRLNGVLVRVPPLRERKEDIPLLTERFLEHFQTDDHPLVLQRDALACLVAYDYPGNVRELETTIRRAVLFATDGHISASALPEEVVHATGDTIRLPLRIPETGSELLRAKERAQKEAVGEIERAFLKKALAAADGRPGEAARKVEMNRSQFSRMLSRHGLTPKRVKSEDLPTPADRPEGGHGSGGQCRPSCRP